MNNRIIPAHAHEAPDLSKFEAYRRKIMGYELVTANITYRMPDHRDLLQQYIWQDYDMAPELPMLHRFLAFWQRQLDGPLVHVEWSGSKLITGADLRNLTGVFSLN